MSARRPFGAGAGVLTAVHQAIELGLGTGVIGQSSLGLPAAVGLSVVLDAGWVAAARRPDPPQRSVAYLSGVAMGVPVVHFTLWPWSTRWGVPLLDEAEGLPPKAMGLYNAILYAWFAAGLLSVWRETAPRDRWYSLAGFVSVVGFRRTARQHFAWIDCEARRNPRWWNRAWQPAAGTLAAGVRRTVDLRRA